MKLTGQTLLVLAAMIWAAIAFRIYRYPENHVGYSVLWLLPLFATMVVVGVWRRAALGHFDGYAWLLLLVGVSSATAAFVLYEANILVPYEVWLKRGMPERPF